MCLVPPRPHPPGLGSIAESLGPPSSSSPSLLPPSASEENHLHPSCHLLLSAKAVASFPQDRPSQRFSVPSSWTSLHPMLSSPLQLQPRSLGLTSISLLILTSQSFVSWTIFSDSSDFISSPALAVLVSLGFPCSGHWSSLPTFPPVIPSPRVTSHHGLQLPVMCFQPRPQVHVDGST